MINKILQNNRFEYIFPRMLILTIIFYFYKTAFWPLTYLFIVCYVIVLILILIRFSLKLMPSKFFNDFLLPFILTAVLIIAIIFNGQIDNKVLQKDVLLLAVLFSLFYFLSWNNANINKGIPKAFVINLIIIITASISSLNLLLEITNSIIPFSILNKLNISEGATIANDYNFFCVFLLFGLIIVNFKSRDNSFSHGYSKLTIFLLNFLFIINIILSGSRRGLFALIILGVIYLIFYFYEMIRNSDFKNIIKKTIIFIIVGSSFFLISMVIYHKTSKYKISAVAYKYASIVGLKDYSIIERFLWNDNFHPSKDNAKIIERNSFSANPEYWAKNPDSETVFSKIETPYGSGIKLTKIGAKNEGFSLYYTGPKILYLANHTYKISFKIKFISGNSDSFSVGWWTEDGGRGTANTQSLDKKIVPIGDNWYNCTCNYTFFENQIGIPGFINSIKDGTEFIITDFELSDSNFDPNIPRFLLEVTGQNNILEWLNKINPPSIYNTTNLIINGDFDRGLTNWKFSADYLNINLDIEDGKKCALIERGNGNGMDWSLYYTGRDINFLSQNEYQIRFKFKPVIPDSIPFKVGFWLDEGEGFINNLKLNIDTLNNGWRVVTANYKFKNNQNNLLFPINSQIDNSKFFITDIELFNITTKQVNIAPASSERNSFTDESLLESRMVRWNYAFEIWKLKYTFRNKLFGHGFHFIEWYGKKFNPNSVAESYDWPHNPFISILLYSGVLGLTAYIVLLIRTVQLYIKYMKKYGIFFIGFILTFFFSFFSGSNPFDPPIMGFFILMPFFIHSINRNANSSSIDN